MDFPQASITHGVDNALLTELRVHVPGYRLTGILGRGGQATVYKAANLADGGPVAIKILHGGPLADADARVRFGREIIAIKALNHPNIVTHRASGQTPAGHDFLIMNFIDGQRLDEYLWGDTKREDVDLLARLRLFIKICRAVGEAHRAGITHRDLSPANIRMDAAGEPHILDFGLARADLKSLYYADQPSVTATNQFVGRLAYASPEQVPGGRAQVDIRSDVYSLGVILYQLLTGGRFPYDVRGSVVEVLENILHRIPRSLNEPTCPAGQEALRKHACEVALHALRKKAANRPGSANELALEIERTLNALPPRTRRLRLHKRMTTAAALATVSALGMACVWVHSRGMARHAGTTLPPSLNTAALPKSFGNSMGMNFVRIEGAEFTMGSSLPPQKKDQMFPHRVDITQPFLIQTTLVTRGQFESFVNATGYVTDAERRGGVGTVPNDGPPRDPGLSWKTPGVVQESNHPVVCLSWNDAMRFVAWLRERDGNLYRLPTEAEWELACRGGHEGEPYVWGQKINPGPTYANANWGIHVERTTPVGSLLPNDFGLYDMEGNAWEWCADNSGLTDDDAVDPIKMDDDKPDAYHVIRGSAYATAPQLSRIDTRYSAAANQANYASGFGLVIGKPITGRQSDLGVATSPANL